MSTAGNFIRSEQGFSPASALLILMLAVTVGLGFYLYRQNHSSQAPASSQSTTPNPQVNVPATPAPAFDIEAFYANIQNGMTPDEVIKAAGKQPDDCGSTDAIPPSVTCFWNSGSKSVTVSYGNKDAVLGKSKRGF